MTAAGIWGAWVLMVSLCAFCLMGFDKRRAKKDGWRVRERSLWAAALVGGGPGALLGLHHFRHKSQRWQFRVGFFLLAAVDIGVLVWLMVR